MAARHPGRIPLLDNPGAMRAVEDEMLVDWDAARRR
jgi:hypothetical protein